MYKTICSTSQTQHTHMYNETKAFKKIFLSQLNIQIMNTKLLDMELLQDLPLNL